MILNEHEPMIIAMRDVIIDTVHPVQIILFGSFAAGTATAHSDADFLIIEQQQFGPERSRRKEAAKIWRALMPFEIPKDILVYSVAEIQKLKENTLHIVGQAIATGRVLYAHE
jgi:uncharacterized protein